ncbi:MAG: AsmA-like C-terminal region-containing protein, partial [Hoeflea sp.]|uniref:AsmA-like C-terminal region-containing protein n=1 Tax=Hoeflea sp. TaxID=1940281 RepID=UPI0027313A9F
ALQRFEALEVAIGPAILRGRLERQIPAAGAPSLSVELAGDSFDVDAVKALALLAGADSGAARPLSQYNLAARIAADSLTIGDYRLDGFATSLIWRDGLLTLNSLSFDDFGGAAGSFSASLEGSVAAPRGTVTGALSADTAAGLFALADRATGGHQIIRRLAANSAAFDDLSADIDLVLDPEAGPELVVNGAAGGSTVSFRAAGTGLMPGGDGPRTIAVEARNPEAYRILEQAGFAVLPLEGEGPASLTLTADGGGEDGDLAITAHLISGQSRLSLEGNGAIPAAAPATGLFELDLRAQDIEPFAMMFGLSLPQVGAGLPFSMTASLALAEARTALSEIEGQAEDNGFSGALAFDRSQSGLSGEGSLRLDRVDLDWLGELALGPQLFGSDGATWSDAPFLSPAPGQPQMRIALSAGEIDLGIAGTAREFTADLSTGSGMMTLEAAEAQWFGGRLGGNVSLTNSDGSVFLSGRLSASDADLAALERAIRGASVLSGKAGATVSLEGTGKSIRELVASLAGGGELAAGDLIVSGIDPGVFPRILGAADREGFEFEPGAVATTVTGFMTGGEMKAESISLPFTLTGGIMRFSSAAMGDDRADLAGDARVDLNGLRLETEWRLAFEPGVEAIAGGDPSLRFGVGGLLADPAVSVDAGQLTNYLSMRAFERERRKVELLQAGVVEKQRLRREVALLKENAAIREAEARARAEAEEAARLAAEEAARLAAEAEAAQRAAEEALRQAAEAAEAERQAAAEAERQAAEAERLAAEEAERQAAEADRLARDAADALAAEAEAREAGKSAAQRAAEEAARQKALQAPPTIERRPLLDPLADPASAITNETEFRDLPQLQFDDLPGVDDPIRSLIAPDG